MQHHSQCSSPSWRCPCRRTSSYLTTGAGNPRRSQTMDVFQNKALASQKTDPWQIDDEAQEPPLIVLKFVKRAWLDAERMVGFLGQPLTKHQTFGCIWTVRPLESNMLNLNSCECSSHFQALRLGFLQGTQKEQRFPKWISHWENNTSPSTNPGSSLPSSEHLGIIELIGKSRHICHRAQVVPCSPTTQTAHIPDVLFRQLSWWIELHEAVHNSEIAAGTRPGAISRWLHPVKIPWERENHKFQLWSSKSPMRGDYRRHSTEKVLKDFRKVQCVGIGRI